MTTKLIDPVYGNSVPLQVLEDTLATHVEHIAGITPANRVEREDDTRRGIAEIEPVAPALARLLWAHLEHHLASPCARCGAALAAHATHWPYGIVSDDGGDCLGFIAPPTGGRLGRPLAGREETSMTITIEATGELRPTRYDVRGGMDRSVAITINGTRTEGGVTLAPRQYDGVLDSWGDADHWVSDSVLTAIRTLDGDTAHRTLRQLAALARGKGGTEDVETFD